MKKAKDFSELNTERVYTAIETATSEKTPDPLRRRSRDIEPTQAEITAAREQGKTQGRKGVKAVRINMAFTPDVHAFIKTMARVRGETVTEFTNAVFKDAMERYADQYEKAKEFQELF